MGKHIIDVRRTNEEKVTRSYCGKKLSEWHFNFQDATHAITSIQADTFVQPCKACVKKLIKILSEVSDELRKED